MAREAVEPEKDADGYEMHPAFGLIGVSRVAHGGGHHGAVLFDSDIRHGHTIRITLYSARRQRTLNRDWIGTEARLPIAEVEMSLSQFGAFVASNGVGDGVPCTIRKRGDLDEFVVPELPFAPRMAESMAEVRGAAEKAVAEVREAFEEFEERPIAANRRALKAKIENLPANITFAARSLTEHAENVVQKTKADIEAMAIEAAGRRGLEPGDIGAAMPAIEAGEDEPG